MEQVMRLAFAERFRAWMLAHREAFRAWVKRNIVDDDPYDDESHAATRYVDPDPVERAR